MVSRWQLSTWYIHEFLIEISKSNVKTANGSLFPTICPSWHPPLSFLLSQWVTPHLLTYSNWKWEVTCGSFLSLIQTFSSPSRHVPDVSQILSTLFHYFSLSHHHLSTGYKRLLNGLLVCILIPNPSSHFLHDILFFFFTPLSTSHLPLLVLSKSQTP